MSQNPPMPNTAFTRHDHTKCVRTALGAADALCETRKARMTPTRRRVLEILLEEHKAIGAYDLLERLRVDGIADKPPVAYRALNFLIEQGFVHRIEKLNAYVACDAPEVSHNPMFLICDTCHNVAEQPTDLPDNLGATSKDAGGFLIQTMVIEAQGLCPNCQKDQK